MEITIILPNKSMWIVDTSTPIMEHSKEQVESLANEIIQHSHAAIEAEREKCKIEEQQ